MYPGPAIAQLFRAHGISHVVWIPDSHLGTWDAALQADYGRCLIRPAREGEALAIAAGLLLGGARPLVVIQCTGLFEAGDALRNLVHDIGLPMQLIVGIRGYRAMQSGHGHDNCATFTLPLLETWQLPFTLLDPATDPLARFDATLRMALCSDAAHAIALVE